MAVMESVTKMVLSTKNNARRKKRSFSMMRAQTAIMIAIGSAVLFLFSVEPVIVKETMPLPRELQETSPEPFGNSMHQAKTKRDGLRIKQYQRHAPGRYGMVSRDALRTNVLYPIDALSKNTREYIPALTQTAMETPETKTYPRVIFLGEDDKSAWVDGPTETKWKLPAIQNDLFEQQSTSDGINTIDEAGPLPYETSFFEDCESRVHPVVHPTCNRLHELEMEDETIELLSMKGSWRSAWKVQNDTAVLKILQWDREFSQEVYEQHILDVVVSDLLTASPYVINAYGFCGQSILQEFAPTGGRDFVKSYDIRNRKRLQIARDLARGLADIQSLRKLSHAASPSTKHPEIVFAHNDINIANTIQVHGHVKWNDFNIGIVLRNRKNTNHTEECGAPAKFRADLWRSPEEIRNTSYVQPQYSDMYMFGNILYQVMTRHQPWTHKEPEKLTVQQVADRKREGRLPTIPEKYRNTTNKDLQTMMMATIACYHPIPSKRLTAFELANALGIVYDRLEQKQQVPRSMLRELFFRK